MLIDQEDISISEKIAWLRLSRSNAIEKNWICDIISMYGYKPDAIIDDIEARISRLNLDKFSIMSKEDALIEYEKTIKCKGDIIPISSNSYPQLLRETDSSPFCLSYIGNHSLLQKKSIAIVGSRDASINGKFIAQHFASQLVKRMDLCIVSGMAIGVDASAHIGSMNGSSIGVLGTGIDGRYPAENKDIYMAMIDNNNLLITEFAIESEAKKDSFPRRNKIIAGISNALLLIEAQKNSGSMTTVKAAQDYKRQVFCIPGSMLDHRYEGNNMLIRSNDAKLVPSIDDLCQELDHIIYKKVMDIKQEIAGYMAIENPIPNTDEIDDTKRLILESMNYEGIEVVTISNILKIDLKTTRISMMELEMQGFVARDGADKFVRIIRNEALF